MVAARETKDLTSGDVDQVEMKPMPLIKFPIQLKKNIKKNEWKITHWGGSNENYIWEGIIRGYMENK